MFVLSKWRYIIIKSPDMICAQCDICCFRILNVAFYSQHAICRDLTIREASTLVATTKLVMTLYNTLHDVIMWKRCCNLLNYSDFIMGAMASQITSLTIVYSTVYSGAHQRKHQSSASLAFVRGIHRWPVNSPHTWPVTRKMFSFDDVIMTYQNAYD